ncbi:transposase [Mycobacterium avium subsp. hominissuis]|uniref:transposase n=1 Tax=Mycobacterium avium TaxID=1764 RepID=UPI0031401FFF
MPKKYDEEFKARAVRLVSDHAEEYATRTACLTAVAKRLGVSYESLRRWINQAEVDTGVRDGAPTDTVRELRELKRKNRELEEMNRPGFRAHLFLREGWHDAEQVRREHQGQGGAAGPRASR